MNKTNKMLLFSNIVFLIIFIALYIYETNNGMHIRTAFKDFLKLYLVYSVSTISQIIKMKELKRDNYADSFEEYIKEAFATDKKNFKKLINCIHLICIEETNEALKKLESLYNECVTNADKAAVLFFKGLCYRDNGDIIRATQCYEQSLQYDTNNSTAWSNLGYNYDKLGRTDKAYYAYEQALVYEPNSAETLGAIAKLYCNVGDFNTAFSYVQNALSIDKTDSGALSVAALLYAHMGDANKALEYCNVYGKYGSDKKMLTEKVNAILNF